MPLYSTRQDHTDAEQIRCTASIRIVATGQASGAAATYDVDALLLTQTNRVIPADAKIVGAHVECETAATFSAVTTTGLGFVVGITGTTNGFLTTGAVTALTAGQKSDLGGLGTLINRIRANTAPALEAVATATGGTPNMTEVLTGVYWLHLEYVVSKGRVVQS